MQTGQEGAVDAQMSGAVASELVPRARVQQGRGRGSLTADQQAGQPQQLPAAHKCLEHFLSRKKKDQTAFKSSGCMLNEVFFCASSVEIKSFLLTSAFSQLCARLRA